MQGLPGDATAKAGTCREPQLPHVRRLDPAACISTTDMQVPKAGTTVNRAISLPYEMILHPWRGGFWF
jgi:hypothetical protein